MSILIPEESSSGLFFLYSARALSAAALTWMANGHSWSSLNSDEKTNLVRVPLFNRIPQEAFTTFPTARWGGSWGLIKVIITVDNLPTDVARESATIRTSHLVALRNTEVSLKVRNARETRTPASLMNGFLHFGHCRMRAWATRVRSKK